ncbi:DNA repair protein REV1-like isoform X2 [Xenia sp. Carnegie-2017]|uniref:DNA repair protein REV1-like isoform X2 n=1 Tax=Xenia sp. Carnegie-2017 TaxID=2897299 RepID=UPI001F03AC05|nr:DNA repair protein REV1-like isoform X2 [Xenia sp. Carnegie-2017]
MSILPSFGLKERKRELEPNNEWSEYMKAKICKLDQQYDVCESRNDVNDARKDLFKNVVIFVNGYTVPSSDELKILMKKHGGGYQHYYSKSKCTHIIATNLPDSKIKDLKTEKVVHPNWIVESIRHGTLLPYRQFLLYGGKNDAGTATTFIGSSSKCSEDKPHPFASSLDTCTRLEDFEKEGSSRKNEQEKSNDVGRNEKSKTSIPKAGDENFLTDYYTHSRLHYLSTWSAEFRDFINNLIHSTQLKRPARKISGSRLQRNSFIMHVDMDSFFVSVALRTRPELRGKPVVVCHAKQDKSTSSTSEIASCSYEARSFGVKNGMWLGNARKLCPHLVCAPYEFEEYRRVSQQLYEIIASYTHQIQAVSCDECFADLSDYMESECLTASEVARMIREDIISITNCPASAGIASNMLLARLCTRVAKPNGQFHLPDKDVPKFIGKQMLSDLPGVGHALNEKLMSFNMVTCEQLQSLSKLFLQQEFGEKTGEKLFKYSRGIDDRKLKLEQERKSVSAEINYAIRFDEKSEPEKFIDDLSNEVYRRLKNFGVKGKQIMLKLSIRQKDAPINPKKFMGHGLCDNISRTVNLKSYTDDPNVIAKECKTMLKALSSFAVSDIRGMGIQVAKLLHGNHETPVQTLDDFISSTRSLQVPRKEFLSNKLKNEDHRFKSRVPVLRKETSPRAKTRGSPKKWPKTNDVSSFKTNTFSNSYLFLPREIDLSVFHSLPDDLKKEVETSYRWMNAPLTISHEKTTSVSIANQNLSNNDQKIDTQKYQYVKMLIYLSIISTNCVVIMTWKSCV